MKSNETMSSCLPGALNYHRWVHSLFQPYVQGRTLEVGFGYGQYTPMLWEKADSVIGIDLDGDAVASMQKRSTIGEYLIGDISKIEDCEALTFNSFDFIVCLNVLEHIRKDNLAVSNIFKLLKSGSYFFVLVPALKALYGPMDSLAGHYRRYDKPRLFSIISDSGLQMVSCEYFNCLGGLGWWFNSRFFKPESLSDPTVNSQIKLFDKYFVPLSKFTSRFTAPFWGQSIWALARKI